MQQILNVNHDRIERAIAELRTYAVPSRLLLAAPTYGVRIRPRDAVARVADIGSYEPWPFLDSRQMIPRRLDYKPPTRTATT